MMPLLISDAAHSMMAAYCADCGRVMTGGVRCPDGRWLVQAERSLVRKMLKIHPDPSQAIIQLCESANTRRRS